MQLLAYVPTMSPWSFSATPLYHTWLLIILLSPRGCLVTNKGESAGSINGIGGGHSPRDAARDSDSGHIPAHYDRIPELYTTL